MMLRPASISQDPAPAKNPPIWPGRSRTKPRTLSMPERTPLLMPFQTLPMRSRAEFQALPQNAEMLLRTF